MKKISINVIKYFPSMGGTENLAKQITDYIYQNKKYKITVKTSKEENRDFKNFPYEVREDIFHQRDEFYDLNIFFSDLWSPQLNNFNVKNKNICILNLDDITYKSKKNFLKAIENLKKFDLVISFSKKGVVNTFLEQENIKYKYVPNFCRDVLSEKPLFNLREKIKCDNRPIGFYCAAFYRIKNQVYLLNLIKQNKELQNYNWIFMGNEADSVYYKECLRITKDSKTDNIFFIQSTKDILKINSIYQQIDFFSLLSLGEGMPLTILESLSANKPIIHTPVGGISGVLEALNGKGVYCVNDTQYSAYDLDINIKKALDYNSNILRETWAESHNKEFVLNQYIKLINDLIG